MLGQQKSDPKVIAIKRQCLQFTDTSSNVVSTL